LGLGPLALGFLVALVISLLRPAPATDPAQFLDFLPRRDDPLVLEVLQKEQQEKILVQQFRTAESFADALWALRVYSWPSDDYGPLLNRLGQARGLSPERLEVVQALLHSLWQPQATEAETEARDQLPEPLRELEDQRRLNAPVTDLADVYLAQAEFWLANQDFERADAALQKASAPDRLAELRRNWIDYLLIMDDYTELEELMQRPGFQEHISALTRYLVAVENLDWEGMARNLVPAQYEGKTPEIMLLAALTGIFWWLILLRIFQTRFWSTTTLLTLVALVLGAISTWPTLLSMVWVENAWGLDRAFEEQSPVNAILYQVASTGLREETCKLLLFLPLVYILLKRQDHQEMLLVAACVGLGFAVEENLNYFQGTATAVTGRFLTANFAHCIWTGMIGYYFCRCIMNWRQDLSNFLTVFTIMVFAHGFYNALMDIDLGGGFLSIIIFIFVSWYFFGLADALRKPGRTVISATSLFILGLSLMLAVTLVVLSFQLPLTMALMLMAAMAVESLVLGIMFIRCFGEVQA
jgi:RsiW-degrading membrane proteinase PrsW (M82 family)